MTKTPAPNATYEPGHGWNIDGTLHTTVFTAITALEQHPGYTGVDPLDELMDLQLPAVNAALPEGVEVYGDLAVGYAFTCVRCNLRTHDVNPTGWASSAYKQAVGHVRVTHETTALLPKRTPGTRIQDAIDAHKVDVAEARKIAHALGLASANALASADEDGYLTQAHPASLAALERRELLVRAENPPVGHSPRSYRLTPLGRAVAAARPARTV
ncbi:hypothetical protein ACWFMI_24775 [Nocardiopsis terrae]|uniref:hypothetical protein n=1 Tax=Streptomyces sp. NPDC057554 TaxID=3350538 RepID=UPI0036C36008